MNALSRRELLSGIAALAAAGALPGSRPGRAAGRPALPIPPELRADAEGTVALRAQPGEMEFRPGVRTPTYGINGPFLGPAIRVRRGDRVAVKVTNGLDEAITLHWHGLKIPGDADGSPYNLIRPGATWRPTLEIDQPAATCWFHPHVYPATAELVIKGLAGLFLIDDAESDALGLPSRWGVDDIPLILQDRRFNPDGSFFHRFNLVAVTAGYVGDSLLVNGAAYPEARTARGWLRLRLLNGSNARSYRLGLSDGRSLYVVASDGGLLSEPVELKELTIYGGERYEVLVDARNGRPFDLVSRPTGQMAMNLPPFDGELPLVTLRPDGAEGEGRLPDALVQLPPLVAGLPPVSRNLVMQMLLDAQGMDLLKAAGLMKMDREKKTDPAVVKAVTKLITDGPALPLDQQLGANAVNGTPFRMGAVSFSAPLKTDLRWLISEGSDRMQHPVHIHGCQFRILALDGKPPPAQMAGWKDIAPIEKGGTAEIQVRFDHPAPREHPFMAHCHNLEHEDSGMMTDFSVA
ncbi:blue copper oxidase [Tistlia consotensis]|uniref:Blue copper oxidase n=1 Tax=Tistlia consotensis USBA 355 TaxID=560819 RepID=A0A1Y6CDN2_9PROT|nr:multicopper oxidase CueO [Tistlia consotensis]SMF55886.1 blue copper oxidase [Tistlia consotensis USBA 355]SNR89489.1 blue copper oxidase [Tistlia consotensis]